MKSIEWVSKATLADELQSSSGNPMQYVNLSSSILSHLLYKHIAQLKETISEKGLVSYRLCTYIICNRIEHRKKVSHVFQWEDRIQHFALFPVMLA